MCSTLLDAFNQAFSQVSELPSHHSSGAPSHKVNVTLFLISIWPLGLDVSQEKARMVTLQSLPSLQSNSLASQDITFGMCQGFQNKGLTTTQKSNNNNHTDLALSPPCFSKSQPSLYFLNLDSFSKGKASLQISIITNTTSLVTEEMAYFWK